MIKSGEVTLTLTLTRSHSHAHTLTLTLTLTRSHAHAHAHTHAHTHTLTRSRSRSQAHTHAHAIFIHPAKGPPPDSAATKNYSSYNMHLCMYVPICVCMVKLFIRQSQLSKPRTLFTCNIHTQNIHVACKVIHSPITAFQALYLPKATYACTSHTYIHTYIHTCVHIKLFIRQS